VRDEALSSCDAELQVLGIDHPALAVWLTASWNLPAGVVWAVAGHHHPDAVEGHARAARIVSCGNLLAHVFAGAPVELRGTVAEQLRTLGLPPADAETLVAEVLEQLAGMGDLV
jgi:HD-like signal output (HDOD) protein